jgi:hypothetical protein
MAKKRKMKEKKEKASPGGKDKNASQSDRNTGDKQKETKNHSFCLRLFYRM